MDMGISLAANARNHDEAMAALGGGWVAEEAFGISLYCALKAADFSEGIRLAVNHDGDSETTGSLVGQLLGAQCGYSYIPTSWTDSLELKELILAVADDLSAHEKWNLDYMDTQWYDRATVERYLGN
jgi:ADP-ribosylglycohydrolase